VICVSLVLHSHNLPSHSEFRRAPSSCQQPAHLPFRDMASAMTDGPPIQCWTCRRKRLVCDSTRPACTKCFKRGTVCPGYGAKPLTWVEPGQKRSSKYKNRPAKGASAVEVPEMAIVKSMKPRFRGVDACLSRSFDSQAVLHAIDYCEYSSANFHISAIHRNLIFHPS
jgi:hypothetical protein